MATKFEKNGLYLGFCKHSLCVYRRVFRVGLSNAANEILPRPFFVAMATKFVKFGQNWLELGLHISSIGSPKYLLPDILHNHARQMHGHH